MKATSRAGVAAVALWDTIVRLSDQRPRLRARSCGGGGSGSSSRTPARMARISKSLLLSSLNNSTFSCGRLRSQVSSAVKSSANWLGMLSSNKMPLSMPLSKGSKAWPGGRKAALCRGSLLCKTLPRRVFSKLSSDAITKEDMCGLSIERWPSPNRC